jgi:sec-independent protein translocase protein TatB
MGISPPIQVASLGMADSLILMVLALVVFGPRRLPQIGRQLGKLMYEFRKASNDFKYQMEEELRNSEEADRRKREEAERQRTLAEAQTAVAQAQTAAAQALSAAQIAQNAAQVAQVAAEAPVVAEASLTISETYSETYIEESTAAEPAGTENPAPEPGPLRVQPPSTGEQVAARRPGRGSDNWESPEAETTGAPQNELEKAAAAKDPPAATETTAHHG